MTQQVDLNENANVASQTKVLQIIVAAMVVAVLAFAMLSFFLQDQEGNNEDRQGIAMITYVAAVFAVVSLTTQAIIPKMVTQQGLRFLKAEIAESEGSGPDAQTVIRRLLGIFTSKTIVGCALAEGAAFFAIVAYLIEGHLLAFGIAAVMLVSIVVRFPTQSSVRHWCENALLD